ASVDSGGVIGVYLAAPGVYNAEPFLRLVIKRLVCRVPEADTAAMERSPLQRISSQILVAALSACVAAGVTVILEPTREAIGIAIALLGLLPLGLLLRNLYLRFLMQPLEDKRRDFQRSFERIKTWLRIRSPDA